MRKLCRSIIIFSLFGQLLLSSCSKSGRRTTANRPQQETPGLTELQTPSPSQESTPIFESRQSSADSPTTGTDLIQPRGVKGRGTLKVTNGTNRDAVVKLSAGKPKKMVRLVYIRANSEFTLEDIGVGKYLLKFTLGFDWNSSERKFTREKQYLKFDDLLIYAETKTKGGIEWEVFEVTLHTVFDGNAKTTLISESEFEDKDE
jgi:hypothetical protein